MATTFEWEKMGNGFCGVQDIDGKVIRHPKMYGNLLEAKERAKSVRLMNAMINGRKHEKPFERFKREKADKK